MIYGNISIVWFSLVPTISELIKLLSAISLHQAVTSPAAAAQLSSARWLLLADKLPDSDQVQRELMVIDITPDQAGC